MMGSNRGGKELPMVGSGEVSSQASRVSQITASATVLHSSGESIQQVPAEPYPARMLTVLPSTPDQMSDVQGRFSQLPAHQKKEFMNWMLRNVNSTDIDPVSDDDRRKQAASNVQASMVQDSEALNKFSREHTIASESYTLPGPQQWKIDSITSSGSNVVPSQSEVLSGIQALPYEVCTTSGGGTVSYIPVQVAGSQSTSGLSYATPIYSTDLLSAGEQISYVQPVAHDTRTPQHAQVIGHISELQGNREISVVVSNSPTTPTIVGNTSIQSHTSQVLDTEGIMTVTPVMLVPGNVQTGVASTAGQEQIVQQHNEEPVQSVQQSVMVIKDMDTKVAINQDPYGEEEDDDQAMDKKGPESACKGRRKRRKRSGRKSPCEECKRYFHLELDESKKFRIWRERTHTCPHCDKMFRTRQHLKVHERIHTGVKPYVCGTCNKSFAQSSAAKAHYLLHTMPKPFTCEICNKSVTTKGNLKLHMALHTGQKPYTCRYCNKSFPRKSNLDQHILVHTGEKPHACRYCGKLFRSATSRSTHERIHTGEKPYTCRYCGKAFSDRRNYTSHERIHTGGYSCDACGKCFSDRRRVKSHQCKPFLQQQQLQEQPQQLQQQEQQQQQSIDDPTIQQQLELQGIQPSSLQQPQQHHQLVQEQLPAQDHQQQQPDSQQLQQLTTL